MDIAIGLVFSQPSCHVVRVMHWSVASPRHTLIHHGTVNQRSFRTSSYTKYPTYTKPQHNNMPKIHKRG